MQYYTVPTPRHTPKRARSFAYVGQQRHLQYYYKNIYNANIIDVAVCQLFANLTNGGFFSNYRLQDGVNSETGTTEVGLYRGLVTASSLYTVDTALTEVICVVSRKSRSLNTLYFRK